VRRKAIDADLKNNTMSLQKISKKYRVSIGSLFNLKRSHMEILAEDQFSVQIEYDRDQSSSKWRRYKFSTDGIEVGNIYLNGHFWLVTKKIILELT